MTTAQDFVHANTTLGHALHVPEIRLHLATEITPIWQATEAWLAERNIAPPFWAFAWPGGQALARHILDTPNVAAGKRVLDFAAGGGIAAIACAMAGAALVEAAEIDDLALAAIGLNAAANGVTIVPARDVVGERLPLGPDPVRRCLLRGPDDRPHHALADADGPNVARVWIADPGRAYLPKAGLEAFASYRIETTLELEDQTSREVVLYNTLHCDDL